MYNEVIKMFTDDDQHMQPLLDANIESGMITQVEEQNDVVMAIPNTANTVSVWHVLAASSALVFAGENQPRIAAAAMLSILGIGLNFLSPMLLGEAIQLLTDEENTETLAGVKLSWLTLGTLLVASYALVQLISNARDQVIAPVTGHNVKQLMSDSMAHLLKQSLHYHVNVEPGKELFLIYKGFGMSIVGTQLLTQILPMALQILIAGALVSSQYDVELGSSLVLLSVVYAVYSAITAKSVIGVNKEFLDAWMAVSIKTQGALSRYKIMCEFGKFKETMTEIDAILTHCWSDAFVKSQTKPLQIGLGHITLSYAHMLLAVMYVGSGVQSGKYTVQDFVVIVGYLLQLSTLMPAFGSAINQVFAEYPNLNAVLSALADDSQKMKDLHPDIPVPMVAGRAPSIEFENVSFSYPPKPGELQSTPIYNNISFKVESNQRVALVGKNAEGKTTLFKLLFGYYTPTSGVIKINGQDITQVSLKALQRSIGYFGQNSNLFKGSIRENICYGAEIPEAVTDDMIWELARASNLHDFLNGFEHKLDTDVGELGQNLSGGQQQKIAILRGLIRKSAIWLFDEPAASFDSTAATQFLQTINEAHTGVTSMMITHQLNQVRLYADLIVVIDEGRVIAHGTHDELFDTCEIYNELYRECNNQGVQESSRVSNIRSSFFASSVPPQSGVIRSDIGATSSLLPSAQLTRSNSASF